MDNNLSALEQIRWLPVRNDFAGEIPPFAVMRPTGLVVVEGVVHIKVDRPSTTLSYNRKYLLNGPSPIPQGTGGLGGFGQGTYDYQVDPIPALYNTAVVPAVGEEWGPKPGEWKLFKEFSGFIIEGLHASGRVFVTGGEIEFAYGMLSECNMTIAAAETIKVNWTIVNNTFKNISPSAVNDRITADFDGNYMMRVGIDLETGNATRRFCHVFFRYNGADGSQQVQGTTSLSGNERATVFVHEIRPLVAGDFVEVFIASQGQSAESWQAQRGSFSVRQLGR